MPHKVRSSHDELNAADICKPLRHVETGMKECGSGGISWPSRATDPLTPACNLQQYSNAINTLPADRTASNSRACARERAWASCPPPMAA